MEFLFTYMILPYVYMFFWLGLFLIIFKFGLKYLKSKNKNEIKNIDKSIYYRDIPCYGNIDLAYWLLYNFSDLKKDELNNGLIGAYLLKWYKSGCIDIIKSENLVLKSDNYSIDLKDGKWSKNYVESRIYNFLKTVAGNNNILEKNEIRNYCSVDGNSFELRWLFENILREIKEDLERQNCITVIPAKDYILFKIPEKITLSDEIIKEYEKLNGLNNFLLDYSNMEDKQHIEIHLWEDYLVFANLLGITDKVKEQFKKIYPDSNIVNNIFNISLDNTIAGRLGIIYNSFKLQFISLGACILLIILVFLGDGNFILSLLKASPFVMIIVLLYWLLKKHDINKKVKEMYKTTYAKITKVDVYYNEKWDYETKRNIKTESYSFTYEYKVNDETHIGYERSDFKKKEGQTIKIYYNEMKPEKSETATKHNRYLTIFKIVVVFLIILFLFIINTI